jgi:chemotaxis protein methyltransferase CheR
VIESLDPAALSDLAIALQRACGVVFSDSAARPLRSGFASAAAELKVPPEELLLRIRSMDRAATQTLVESTVVGETYFWRHPEQLEALRKELRAIPRDRPVAVWSAGCATGEEAYTIAMLLLEEGRTGSVVATDVSERALLTARSGRYGPWSLRGLASLSRMRWLRPDGDGWAVADEVRKLVRFERLNLLHDPPPGPGFDVVICRNVLIYFDRPTIDGVVRRLFEAARGGGVVMLAPAEFPFAAALGYTRIEFRNGALWRKAPAADATRVTIVPRRAPPPGAASRSSHEGSDPASPRASAAVAEAPATERTLDPLEGARRAAAGGRWLEAEREASAEGERSLQPGPYLFAAAAAEARGDLQTAAHWLGRALFLAPDHVVARASLVPILERMGRRGDAARARRAALRDLAAIPDEQLLPGVEPIAAGALRGALLAFSAEEASE